MAGAFLRRRPPRRPRRRGRDSPSESSSEEADWREPPFSGGFTSEAEAAERPTFSIRTSVRSPISEPPPTTETT